MNMKSPSFLGPKQENEGAGGQDCKLFALNDY